MVYFKLNKHTASCSMDASCVVVIFLCTIVVNYYCILMTHSFG